MLKYEKPTVLPQNFHVPLVDGTPEPSTELSSDVKKDVDGTLDSIFGIRRFKQDGKWCRQRVSRELGLRNDVLSLEENLNQELERQGAEDISSNFNDTKIDLYFQCLDELIRQEVVVCPERGALLHRVKTQHLEAILKKIKLLCQSTFVYGVSKALQIDQEVMEAEERLANLKIEYDQEKTKCTEVMENLGQVQIKVFNEIKKQMEEYTVQEEILEESNQLLQNQLEAIVDPSNITRT